MAQRVKTDWILFPTIIFLVCFGLLMVYSASSITAHWSMLIKQFIAAVLAFAGLMLLKSRDYRKLNSPVWAFAPLGVVVVLLIAVYFLDPGKHRFLRLGPTGIQPSEFAKPALILFLAWFISMRAKVINSLHTLGPVLITVGALAVFVIMADLGTAVVLIVIAGVGFLAAGLKMRYLGLAILVVCIGIVGAVAQKPYRLGRVIGYVDPKFEHLQKYEWGRSLMKRMSESAYARDPGYHARQSKIAVGSGGIAGLGPMQGKQKLYIPESHTDFIYAVVCEEFGFLGAATLVAAFLIILWRGTLLARSAPDDFGRYLALGVTTMIVFQAFMNMSVVLNLFPTKGIPLPMISYGGSSLVSSLLSLGLLLGVSEQTR